MPATRIKPSDVRKLAQSRRPYRKVGAPPHNAALREELRLLGESMDRRIDELERGWERLRGRFGAL